MIQAKIKFAVLSHVVPPEPSGQSILIHRLLADTDKDRYCLISCSSVSVNDETPGKLPANYYRIKKLGKLPSLRFKFISFAVKTIFAISYILIRSFEVSKLIKKESVEALVVCTGDIYDLPSAFLASKMKGIPLHIYIMDDYIGQWMGYHRALARVIERFVVCKAKSVIVTNDFIKEEYHERYGIDPRVIGHPLPSTLCGCNDSIDISSSKKDVNIVYTGSVYHAHYDAFVDFIEALSLTKFKSVGFHIFSLQDSEELGRHGIRGDLIEKHDHIDPSQVQSVLGQADFLFLPLSFSPDIEGVIRTSLPIKTGDYLASGKPIVVYAPRGSFLSHYFIENKCGLVVDRNDVSLLREAIERIVSDSDLAGSICEMAKECAERDFSTVSAKNKFFEILNS